MDEHGLQKWYYVSVFVAILGPLTQQTLLRADDGTPFLSGAVYPPTVPAEFYLLLLLPLIFSTVLVLGTLVTRRPLLPRALLYASLLSLSLWVGFFTFSDFGGLFPVLANALPLALNLWLANKIAAHTQ